MEKENTHFYKGIVKSGGVEVMGTVVVRNSVAKRVIVTLMPAISFCVCLVWRQSVRTFWNMDQQQIELWDISECPVSFR